MTVQELHQKRSELAKKITAIAGEFKANGQRFKDDAQSQEWDRVNAEYDQVANALGVDKRIRELNAPQNSLGIGFDDAGGGRVGKRNAPGDEAGDGRELAAVASEYVVDQKGQKHRVLRGSDSLRAELAAARPELVEETQGVGLGEYLRFLLVGPKSAAERNALSSFTVSAGGATVPSLMAAELIDNLRAKSRVMEAGAATIRMDAAEVSYATLTGDPTPTWRNEGGAIAESQPTFGKVYFRARNLGMLCKAPRELLQDSVNIEAKLPQVLAQSMALELDRVALFGSGASLEPMGVFNFPGINSVSMGANGAALTDYAQLLDAIEAIETDNATSPNTAIMHPRTWRAYAGLEDTTGQPLARPEAVKNFNFLTTTKIPVNQTQGSANNASSAIVGGFSDLVVAMRSDIELRILNERYGETNEVGFLVTLRADVGAWHEESFCKIIGIIP